MVLALDVRHPRTGRRLLGRGYALERDVVDRLSELHVHEVWVEYPELDAIQRYVAPSIARHHARIVSLMATLFGDLHAEAWADLDFGPYRAAIGHLIEALAVNPDAAIYVVELGGGTGSALRHASEVCFLSLALGLRLHDYIAEERPRLDARQATNLVPLGIGALLHDVGLELIDTDARMRFMQHGDDGSPEIREHVRRGHDLIAGRVPPSAATVVLNHHQAWDGSGYPRHQYGGIEQGLAAHRIHIFARIVAVADTFDRLRYRPDGLLVPRVVVLNRMLMTKHALRFDPQVLRALPTIVPAYPPGSVVTLSDGARVVVTDWDPDHPCQPTVRPITAPRIEPGRPDAYAIDLRERGRPIIVEQDGWNVAAQNFRLRSPWTGDDTAVARCAVRG